MPGRKERATKKREEWLAAALGWVSYVVVVGQAREDGEMSTSRPVL